jgi:hypothetical protein
MDWEIMDQSRAVPYVAQAVSHLLPISAVWDRSCGIYGGQNGTGATSLLVLIIEYIVTALDIFCVCEPTENGR